MTLPCLSVSLILSFTPALVKRGHAKIGARLSLDWLYRKPRAISRNQSNTVRKIDHSTAARCQIFGRGPAPVERGASSF